MEMGDIQEYTIRNEKRMVIKKMKEQNCVSESRWKEEHEL